MKCNLCNSDSWLSLFYRAPYQRIQCRECGLVTVSELPDVQQLKAMYAQGYSRGEMYCDYEADRSVIQRNAHRRLARIERLCPPGILCEVGCTMGFFLDVACARGWSTYDVEMPDYASQYARAGPECGNGYHGEMLDGTNRLGGKASTDAKI